MNANPNLKSTTDGLGGWLFFSMHIPMALVFLSLIFQTLCAVLAPQLQNPFHGSALYHMALIFSLLLACALPVAAWFGRCRGMLSMPQFSGLALLSYALPVLTILASNRWLQ
jgi:hypothetical protein